MRDLYPFLKLYRQYWRKIAIGILLAILTLLASICLLSISGWFLASTAVAGIMGVTFNYLLPSAGVRGSAVLRTVFRYGERLVSHDTTFRILAKLRVFSFRKLLPLTPGAISRFKQAELLNRLVADIDTLDHLYLRLISPIVSAIMVIFIVMVGLLFIDTSLALTLGFILTILVLITPIIFYYSGNPIGISLTQLKGQYRTELTAWLQGQAELAIFNALARFRSQLNNTETKWLNTQQKQASLTGLSQSFIILASGLTTVLILWLAANGVGANHTLNPLIALFTFASLAAFETIAPVATAFLHLSQVTSSAKRVNELLSQQPDVTFTQAKADYLPQASLQLDNISFSYSDQPQNVLTNINLQLSAGQHVALLGKTGCGKSTLLQLLTRAWDRSTILATQAITFKPSCSIACLVNNAWLTQPKRTPTTKTTGTFKLLAKSDKYSLSFKGTRQPPAPSITLKSAPLFKTACTAGNKLTADKLTIASCAAIWGAIAGSKAIGLISEYSKDNEQCSHNANASSLRKPSAVFSQPDATGFTAAVDNPLALAAANKPHAIVVLPISVSVPVIKKVFCDDMALSFP